MATYTFLPSRPLERFISHFYYIEEKLSDVSLSKTKLPTESIELIIHLNNPHFKITNGKTQTTIRKKTLLQGLMKNPVEIQSFEDVSFIGVKFKPNGFYHFLGQDISQFNNQPIDCHDIWGDQIDDWEAEIERTSGLREKVNLIERYLLTKLKPDLDTDQTAYCTQLIQQNNGNIKVNELSLQTNISIRQLERKFKEQIGLSPFQFIKSVKVKSIIDTIQNKNYESLTELTFDYNYFDQSHFIKEFKSHTGKSPKKLQVDLACFSNTSYI